MNLKSTLRSHYQSVKFLSLIIGVTYYLYTLFVPSSHVNEIVTKLESSTDFTSWHEGVLYIFVLLFVGRYFYRLVRYQQKGQFKPLYYAALLLLILGLELYREALPEPVKLDFLALNVFYFVALVWGLLVLGVMMNYFIKSETFQFRVWLSSFFKTKRKNEQTNISEETSSVFQSDIPLSFEDLGEKELDQKLIEYGIREKVNGLAKEIKQFNPKDQAYIISITGKWGVGKTTFLNGLKRLLEIEWEDKKKNHTVSYSPWSVNSSGVVLTDFIEKIGNTVAKENTKLRKLLHKYARMFSPVDRTGGMTMITSLFEQHKSIEEQLEEINDCIKQTEKKLVIFVDDLDRLTPHEVLDVITFMRKTANLYNAFFVCAYDYDFVAYSLKQQNIENPDRYMEKIFPFVVPLHSQPVEGCLGLLSDILEDVEVNRDYVSFSQDGYSNRWEIPENIRAFLSSYRNVKRVYSEVKFAKLLVGDKTLPDKLFVLALFKMKSLYLYNKVWEIMDNLSNEDKLYDKIIINKDQKIESLIYGKLTKYENISETDLLWVKNLLTYLEKKPTKDLMGRRPLLFDELLGKDFSISNLYTYYKYDRADDYIDGVKINWERSDEIIKKLDRLKSQGKKTQFDKYLNNLLNYFRVHYKVKKEEREGKFILFNYLLNHSYIEEEYVEMLRENRNEIDGNFIKRQLTSFDKYPANYNVVVLQTLKGYYGGKNEISDFSVSLAQCKEMQILNLKYLIDSDADYNDIEVAFCVCFDIDNEGKNMYEKAKSLVLNYLSQKPNDFLKRMLIFKTLKGKKKVMLDFDYVAVFDWDKERIRRFVSKHKKEGELINKYLDKLMDNEGNLTQWDASEEDIKAINSKRNE